MNHGGARGLETSTAKLLRQRYAVALLLIALLSGLSQLTLQSLLHQVESNGRVINLAGRQRMLSQRIARDLVAQSWPPSTSQQSRLDGLDRLQDWSRSQAILRSGSASDGIPAPSAQVSRQLEQLQSLFEPMCSQAKLGFESKSASQTAIAAYLSSDRQFVERMDAIVLQLESDSKSSILKLEQVEIALFLFMLLCLAGEAVWIFLPTYRNILNALETLTAAKEHQRELNEQLEQALEAKSLFLANVSHELRTPLNGILGTTELISLSSLDAKQCSQLATIRDSGQLLQTIVNDILDYTQLQNGHLLVVLEPIELSSLATSIMDLYCEPARQKSLLLKASLSPELPEWIQGDGHRIRQVLMSLVSNALKFTSKGEIELAIELHDSILEFSVRDTGIGIDQDSLNQIFERFFQSDHGSARKYGGIGLGLSIAKHLAELMNGSLSASSQLGIGSRFKFTIPLIVCDNPPTQTRPKLEELSGSRMEEMATEYPLKILVAEDNSINQMVIRSQLNSLGYVPVIVDHGGYALEEMQTQAFDLLFLDLHMPVVTGFELLKRLSEGGIQHQPRVVALSATVDPKEQQQALDSGCHAFIGKPYEISDLAEQIRLTSNREKR